MDKETFEQMQDRDYIPTKEQDMTTCPKCNSKDISEEYVSCSCCRTYEGNGRTCWTAPHCNKCGFEGVGSSSGGAWFRWWTN